MTSVRTPSLAEKYDRALNKLIDLIGERNEWRLRARQAEHNATVALALLAKPRTPLDDVISALRGTDG